MTTHLTDQPTAPDPDEQLLREVLDSAMADTRPPATLAVGAISLGRRQRNRRRITIASGAVAASVLAAVAGPWLLSGGEGGPSSTDTNFASEPPPAPNQPSVGPLGWWNMPSAEMVSTVEAILPDEVTVTAPGSLVADTEEGGAASGVINAVITGPGGPGRLNVMLYPTVEKPAGTATTTLTPSPGTEEGGDQVIAPEQGEGCDAPELAEGTLACTEVPVGEELDVTVEGDSVDYDISCAAAHTGTTQCTQIRDEDGTIIGRRLTNRSGNVEMVEVVLRREGGTVYAAAANSLDDKWGRQSPASAEIPPMTLVQLEALVRNDAWTSYQP